MRLESQSQKKIKNTYVNSSIIVYNIIEERNNDDDDILDLILLYLLYKKIEDEINLMYDELRRIMLQSIYQTININFSIVNTLLGTDMYDLTSEQMYQLLVNPNTNVTINYLLERNRKNLLRSINNELTLSLQDDNIKLSGKKITDLIFAQNQTVLSGDVAKAMKLFRTENTRIRTQSKIMAENQLKQLGYKTYRQWVYTWESNVPRSHHVSSHGLKTNDSGYFNINGLITRGPGLFDIASEDINCRCDTDIYFE